MEEHRHVLKNFARVQKEAEDEYQKFAVGGGGAGGGREGGGQYASASKSASSEGTEEGEGEGRVVGGGRGRRRRGRAELSTNKKINENTKMRQLGKKKQRGGGHGRAVPGGGVPLTRKASGEAVRRAVSAPAEEGSEKRKKKCDTPWGNYDEWGPLAQERQRRERIRVQLLRPGCLRP
jgi:hypothetical protein